MRQQSTTKRKEKEENRTGNICIMVTGGAGFIGSNFIHYLLETFEDIRVINYDKLTYAGNLENLKDIYDDSRYHFVRGDICDKATVEKVIQTHGVTEIVNFAAESHVDRSITGPEVFIKTDILGSFTLLEACRRFDIQRYVQISTDEVYGSIKKGSFKETDPLHPSSPYSASKASAELLVNSYFTTYDLPVLITRSSNNFGPYQYPEKLIPLFIIKALHDEVLPLYGDGNNIRDWLHVMDNCEAIDLVRRKGKTGDVYNIGADNEHTNKEITDLILSTLGKPSSLIQYVSDRPGHDYRYSINSAKIQRLGWNPLRSKNFTTAISETVQWYVDNSWWWENIFSKSEESYAV